MVSGFGVVIRGQTGHCDLLVNVLSFSLCSLVSEGMDGSSNFDGGISDCKTPTNRAYKETTLPVPAMMEHPNMSMMMARHNISNSCIVLCECSHACFGARRVTVRMNSAHGVLLTLDGVM